MKTNFLQLYSTKLAPLCAFCTASRKWCRMVSGIIRNIVRGKERLRASGSLGSQKLILRHFVLLMNYWKHIQNVQRIYSAGKRNFLWNLNHSITILKIVLQWLSMWNTLGYLQDVDATNIPERWLQNSPHITKNMQHTFHFKHMNVRSKFRREQAHYWGRSAS